VRAPGTPKVVGFHDLEPVAMIRKSLVIDGSVLEGIDKLECRFLLIICTQMISLSLELLTA
jgi:hypothetical protein